jgi:hypothetical protein
MRETRIEEADVNANDVRIVFVSEMFVGRPST